MRGMLLALTWYSNALEIAAFTFCNVEYPKAGPHLPPLGIVSRVSSMFHPGFSGLMNDVAEVWLKVSLHLTCASDKGRKAANDAA